MSTIDQGFLVKTVNFIFNSFPKQVWWMFKSHAASNLHTSTKPTFHKIGALKQF